MKIAFIGCGQVGGPLADHLQRLGHQVTLAASDSGSASVEKARARNPSLEVAVAKQAVRMADVVFLATPFQAVEEALRAVADELHGKVLVDCTNPVGPGFTHRLKSVESGSEMVQRIVPASNVVKAFSIYGFENLEDNVYAAYDVKPVMMYCGEEPGAKNTVGALIAELGWEPLDVGGLAQALHLEHMTLLWVRMVRGTHATPHIVWAALRR